MTHTFKITRGQGITYKNIPLINRFDYFRTKKTIITFLNGKYFETKEEGK